MQDQMNREVISVWRCSSRPESVGCSGRCKQVHSRGEAAMFCPATTHVSSHTLSKAYAEGSPCRLAESSSGPVAKTRCGQCSSYLRNVINMILALVFACLVFFSRGNVRNLHWLLWHLFSRSYQKSMSHHQG